jgi:CopG family nickel-responsive transcriptional regulator
MISMQISEEQISEFDAIQRKLGYNSRSEALREAINQFILHNTQEQVALDRGHRLAVVSVVYALAEQTLEEVQEINQVHTNLVHSIQEYRTTERVVQVTIVTGDSSEIEDYVAAFAPGKGYQVSVTALS